MNIKALHIFPIGLLFIACGGDSSTAGKAPELVIGDNGSGTHASAIYQMPTPNELFSLVRDLGNKNNKARLNPVSSATKYASLKSRAVNFGIYATDLVYASYYGQNVETARYYLTTKKMADGLGLASAFDDSEFIRLERNVTRGNSDSLEIISTIVYTRAYQKLQAEEMGPVLALVLAGGWVESMHLVTAHMDASAPDAALMSRIAEQKATLEHLIDMMELQAADAGVADLMGKLSGIRDIYDEVNVRRTVHKGRSVSGLMILGDDITMDLTTEKYLELIKAIEKLREELIRPEDVPNA